MKNITHEEWEDWNIPNIINGVLNLVDKTYGNFVLKIEVNL